MPFLALAAAASFVCANPAAIDGQTLECQGRPSPIILEGIGAPRLTPACRDAGSCAGDIGAALRDRLRDLVEARDTVCFEPKSTSAGAARCYVDGVDLSCAMIADSGVVPAGAPLDCARAKKASSKLNLDGGAKAYIELPPLARFLPLYLLAINIISYIALAVDRARARTALTPISETHLLLLAIFGGGPGVMYGQYRLDHLQAQPFSGRLAVIVGLQIGIVSALGVWLYWPSPR